ncbi:PAS domain S-box protein, partial [Bacillus pumilus]
MRVNQKLCDIVGYTREELLSKTFQDITHPDDLDNDLAQMREILDGRLGTYTLEKRYLKKDGSELWIELTVALVRDDAGKPDYFISVVADIGERKRAEEALRISREELRHLSAHILQIREEENGRIARELHDDFAQKLSALKMAVAMMESALPNDDSNASIGRNPRAAAALVDKLID